MSFVTKRKRVITVAGKELDLGTYYLRDWLQPQCYAIQELLNKVMNKWSSLGAQQQDAIKNVGFGNALVKLAWNIVNTEIRYRYDDDLFNQADFWMMPGECYTMKFGDCLTGDTEIVTLKDGCYDFTRIKDLKEGDLVLSYDFEKEQYCFKPVLKVMDKGVKSTYEVSLKNGTWFRCTSEHRLFVYHYCGLTYSGDGKYWYVDVEPLSQFVEEWKERKDFRRQLLCVKKIPSLQKHEDRNRLLVEFGRSNVKLIYNTSSTLLAKQLRFMHWVLGEPLYSWYQVNHQGAGKYPIWRLYAGQKGTYTREILDGVSKVPVKAIEYVGEERTYDITVADTHNFVLADSGLIVHNCEDSSFTLASAVLRLFEIVGDFRPSWLQRWCGDAPNCQVWLGFVYQGGQYWGHAWVAFRNPKYAFSRDWLILESTYESEVPMNLWIVWTEDIYIPVYMFNQQDSWRIDRDYAKLGLTQDYVNKYRDLIDSMINYVEAGVRMPQKWVHKRVRPVKAEFKKVINRRWS